MLDGTPVSLIELIPPVHQRVYRMGLEHLGVVGGEDVDAFSRQHRAVLTGQQFQSEDFEPYYVLFEDFTHVKFYRRSLYDGCISQGFTFDGFVHVDDWVPQRLVTATGPIRCRGDRNRHESTAADEARCGLPTLTPCCAHPRTTTMLWVRVRRIHTGTGTGTGGCGASSRGFAATHTIRPTRSTMR